MKSILKKRFISIFLITIVLLGTFTYSPHTILADYEDGMECFYCDHYHWDEYCCSICGGCSPECTNTDCFVTIHCNHCGECLREVNFCSECGACEDCYVNNGWHCLGCDECHAGTEEELCGLCWFCGDCMGGLCDDCGFCEGCQQLDLMHCEECNNCYGAYELCAFGYEHCEECCVICEQCEECLYEDGIELCDYCGLCIYCCQDNAESEGCDCREFCIEDGDWYEHLCPDCGNAFCQIDMCEDCELCLECCEGNSDCSEAPPVCVQNEDYEFHFCEDCGDCFHNSYICESCEATGTLLCEICCKIRLEEEGCDCSDQCISDSNIDNHIAQFHGNADGSHSATPQNTWDMSTTQHWHSCRFCDDAIHITSKANHSYDKYGICKVCGFDSQKNILILKQPKSTVAKVSDVNAPSVNDPLFSYNNLRIFTIAAKGTSALKYQWYYRYGLTDWKILTDNVQNGNILVSGSKTNTITVAVPEDACYNNYSYRCVITDTMGNKVTSNEAYLQGQHVYNKCTYYKGKLIGTINQPNNANNIGIYECESHLKYCVGAGCESSKTESHSYSKITKLITDSKTGVKWIERTCIDCGFKNYIQDHNHYFYDPTTYECNIDTTYKNNNEHRLKCMYPGCTKTTLESHDWLGWQNHGTPYSNTDKVGIAYKECQICGYSANKKLQTYNAQKDIMEDGKWTQSTDLVYVEGGYASCDLVVIGTKLIIGFSPSRYYKEQILGRNNPKITGWKVRYYCDRSPSGSVVDMDVTKYFSFTKQGDEFKWSLTVPNFSGRTGGGILIFSPVIAQGECSHNGKTRIKGAYDPICTKDGYTGDTVCADCEAVIKYGDIIEGNKEHSGKLTLIAGTAKASSCNERGYEGTYRCSHCNMRVRGRSLGKKHTGKTIIKNAVAVTCTKFGYSGDTYCECGALLKEGEVITPRHTNLRLVNSSNANCVQKGYTGDWVCYACNQTVKYGYNVTKKDHAYSKWGTVDAAYHRHTCVVAGCGAAETALHTDANRDLKCDGCGYNWGSNSLLISNIIFNIDTPVIGSKPDYTKFDGACFNSDGTSAREKNGIQWYDVTDNKSFTPGGVNQEFKEGHVYKVTIGFRTKGDYEFADEGTIKATINGKAATIEYVTYGQFAGISYTFPALVHKHTMTRTNKVAPTCTTSGKQTYYHCSDCNKYYEDSAGKTQISNISTWGILPATGHSPSSLVANSTHHFKMCTVCYAEIPGSKSAHSGGTATCTDKAKCTACGADYGSLITHSESKNKWDYIEKTGHAHMCTAKDCDHVGKIYPHRSSGTATATTDEVCLDCGYIITPSTNHTHSPAGDYKSDADSHWQTCKCGTVMNKKAHTDTNKDGKCDLCSYNISDKKPGNTEEDTEKPTIESETDNSTEDSTSESDTDGNTSESSSKDSSENSSEDTSDSDKDDGKEDDTQNTQDEDTDTDKKDDNDNNDNNNTKKKSGTIWIVLAVILTLGAGAGVAFFIWKKKKQ